MSICDCTVLIQVLRLYLVFKQNAFSGGIYPHVARLNHSCDPNCRFTDSEGRIDVWARQDISAGQEITISYRATDHFSGASPVQLSDVLYTVHTCLS